MNKLFKSAMFFTSFLPLWVTILFINIKSIVECNTPLWTEYISVACVLLGLLASAIIFLGAKRGLKKVVYKKYRILEATQEKGITSEFLLSYILPLFAFDFTKWDDVIQFLIYFSILAFLCIRNNNVYANLFFEIMHYKFYTCELIWTSEPTTAPIQIIAISNKNLCANKGNTVDISPLNKPFYLVK